MPATWTCCRSSAGCTGTGCRTHGCGPPRRSCSACTASATSRAGRSRGATSSSCGAARPRPSPRSPATTTRTCGRWAGCSPTSNAGWATRRRGPWPRPATSPVWPARSPGNDGCPRLSTVSTRPRTGPTSCGRRIGRRRHPPRSSRRVSPPGRRSRTRPGGRPGDRPTSADRRGVSRRHRSGPAARRSGSPGRWSGSPSIAPTSCAASAGTRTRSGPGRRWPPARVARPSSPRSSWPRSTSIAGTIRRRRSRPPTGGSARSSAAAGWGGPSPRSRPTCCGASSGSDRGACQPSARRWP